MFTVEKKNKKEREFFYPVSSVFLTVICVFPTKTCKCIFGCIFFCNMYNFKII